MATLPQNNINLYETIQDLEKSAPYTSINADELPQVIRRFVSWAQMLATHPNTAAKFGESSTAHIQLATDLRSALKYHRRIALI